MPLTFHAQATPQMACVEVGIVQIGTRQHTAGKGTLRLLIALEPRHQLLGV